MPNESPLGAFQNLIEKTRQIGEFVAGPEPDNPIAAAIQNKFRSRCREYSNAAGWFKNMPVPSARAISNVCDPYLDANEWSRPEPSLPFQGGQCDTQYLANVTWSDGYVNAGGWSTSNGYLAGPITGWGYDTLPGGQTVDGVFYPDLQPYVNTAGGKATQGYRNSRFGNPSSIAIFPRYPGTDTCGNPPPVRVPGPNPAPLPTPTDPSEEPYTDPKGRPVIIIGPYDDPYGGPSIELPDIVLPTPGSYTDPDPGLESPVAAPERPGANSDGSGAEDDFGEPPSGEWVGCCVTIVEEPPEGGWVEGDDSYPIYTGVVGNVRILSETADGQVVPETPVQIRQKTTCVWISVEGLTAKGCYVNVKSGLTYVVRPYYRPSEPQEV